jgi:DNA-binding MarR family transcriptional regulator
VVTEPIAPDEVLKALLFSYKAVVSRLEQSFAAANAPSLFESVLLTHLYRAPEHRMRMQDAGRFLMITKSGISRMIDRMVQSGLVERQDWDEDRRVTFVVMTERGREALRHSGAVFRPAFEEIFGTRLNENELYELVVLLQKLGDETFISEDALDTLEAREAGTLSRP